MHRELAATPLLARVQDLRGQLAEAEAALLAAGTVSTAALLTRVGAAEPGAIDSIDRPGPAPWSDDLATQLRESSDAIFDLADRLDRTEPTPEQRVLFAAIRDRGRALVDLIARSPGQPAPPGRPGADASVDLDLGELVEAVGEAEAPGAADRGVEVLVDGPPDQPARYRGDGRRLHALLGLLVRERIATTPVGGVVRLVARPLDEAEGRGSGVVGGPAWFRFSIHDTAGATPQVRSSSIFRRPGPPSSDQPLPPGPEACSRGCPDLVRELRGDIHLSSPPGLGLATHLDIPLERRHETRSPRPPGRPLDRVQVLVVDGRAATRNLLRRWFEDWGAEVVEAETAPLALLFLRSILVPGRRIILLIDEQLLAAAPGFFGDLTDRADLAAVPTIVLATPRPTNSPAGSVRRPGDVRPRLAKPIRRALLLDMVTAVIRPDAPGHPAPAPESPDDQAPLAGVRVLLAEDNPTNQKITLRMLARLGCVSELVADGVEVLARLDQAQFDIVLMDIQMPRMDGLQATGAIRRRELLGRNAGAPTARRLPVIALTANAREGDRERCLAAAMDDYLSKPVTLAQLAEVLGRWVRGPEAPTAPEPAGPPDLRIDRLEEISQGDAEFEREFLDCLLSDVATGLERLRAALDPLDPAQVATTLHGIVGACRTVGADAMGRTARELENQAKQPAFRPGLDWLVPLEAAQTRLGTAIAARLAAKAD